MTPNNATLRLSDFIASTMTEIVAGVCKAQELVAKKGARVNPKGTLIGRAILESSLHNATNNALVDMIEFDLSVSTEIGTQTQGGIGVVIAAFRLNAKGTSSSSNTHENRIRFRIPLQLPQHQ